MHARPLGLWGIGILFCLPLFAHASVIWSSTPTHSDEVLVYATSSPRWYEKDGMPSALIGAWGGSDFTTTASTSAHLWARWNGSYISTLDVALAAATGGDPFYGSGSTTAKIVVPSDGFYAFGVDATSTLQEFTLPVNAGATLHQGDELWAFLTPSWGAYGANHWIGSTGLIPHIEVCEGSCTATDTPPVPNPCAGGNCASNVLFLPGIEGSRLYEDMPCAQGRCETKLWEPNGDTLATELMHNSSGESIVNSIYVKKNGILDNAYIPIKGNIYKSFIGQMNDLVTSGTINQWEAVPYDWRLSLDQILDSGAEVAPNKISYLMATSSPFIIQELKRLAASSKTGKVTIIAHSNGGLLTKRLIEKLGPQASQLIDTVVFVAVPQVGAPQAIGALLHGYDQGLPVNFFPYAFSPSAARTLAKNMPMTYNLLPSSAYFTQIDDPVVTFDHSAILADFRARYGDVIHSQERLHPYLTDLWRTASSTTGGLTYPSVGNDLLLSRAETLHSDLDHWSVPSGISLYEIAGWGELTLAGIDYYQGMSARCDLVVSVFSHCTTTPKIDYHPRLVLDGDGTVPAPSALWTSGAKRYWLNLQNFSKDNRISAPFGRQHSDILEVPELRTFLQTIIAHATPGVLPQYISTSTPLNSNSNTQLHFVLHSPLALDLYDDQGRHTGVSTTTGEIVEDIPESRYLRFGEVQFISVPSSVHTHLALKGYASGSFTLDAEEVSGETLIASTSFAGIPSATSTTAAMNVPAGGLATIGALTVDENNDGHADLALAPSLGNTVTFTPPDTVPPELKITFDTIKNALLFIGTDDQGSTTLATSSVYPPLKKNQKDYKGTATTTITVRDRAGNTTALVYTEELPSPNKRSTIILRALAYNGATTTLAASSASYKWRTQKNGSFTVFASHLRVVSSALESHYRPKKNVTVIMTKPQDLDDSDSDDAIDMRPTKQVLPGIIIPAIQTQKGSLKVIY